MAEAFRAPQGRSAEGIRRTRRSYEKWGALISQKQAADAAGISEHQRTQVVRVANVPASNFEAAIEGEDPATVAALAAMGTKGGKVRNGDYWI